MPANYVHILSYDILLLCKMKKVNMFYDVSCATGCRMSLKDNGFTPCSTVSTALFSSYCGQRAKFSIHRVMPHACMDNDTWVTVCNLKKMDFVLTEMDFLLYNWTFIAHSYRRGLFTVVLSGITPMRMGFLWSLLPF